MTLLNSDFSVDKPYVDPHWKSSNELVFEEILNTLETPASLEHRIDDFIGMNIEVAMAVHKTRLASKMNNVNLEWEDLLPEYPDWYKPNGVKPWYPDSSNNAKYVTNDIPDQIGRNISDYLASQNIKPLVWGKHEDGSKNFHNGIITRARLYAEMSAQVNPTCFFLKFYWKVPRPEKVVQGILDGSIPCPSTYKRILEDCVDQEAVIEDHTNFPVFKGATPGHYSCPAMHTTNAIAQYYAICATWQIEPGSQIQKNCLNACLLNGWSRVLLGVHTSQDNFIAMKVAEYISFEKIPYLLSEWNGADPKLVKERLNQFKLR